MLGVTLLLISFVGTVIGLIHSHAAKPEKISIFGLTRVSVLLISVSLIGLCIGIAKEVESIRAGAQDKDFRNTATDELKKIHSVLIGLAQNSSDKIITSELITLANGISARYSSVEGSDLSMSNFAYSRFDFGRFERASFTGASFVAANFRNALFRNSVFEGADFRGSDLSRAIIDSTTTLPRN